MIAGLGNPGPKYRETRHNVGFRVVDEVARRLGVEFDAAPAEALMARLRGAAPALLVKPLTFMNRSGDAIGALHRYFRVELTELLVVADDVHLALGRLRTRARGSAGGHNGFKSVAEALGTEEFARLRIGVGRGDTRRDLADHVLATFDADEQAAVDTTIARAADAVETFLTEGIDVVMNRFNRTDDVEEG